MDVLADVIAQTRVGGVLFCLTQLHTPFGVTFERSPVAGFHVMTKGQCWLQSAHLEKPIALNCGDVVLVSHGTPHELVDYPGANCVPWTQLETQPATASPFDAAFLCGAYMFDEAEHPHPVFAALPRFLFVRADSARASCPLQSTLRLLLAEHESNQPGSRALVERLVDVLLIYILRCWLMDNPTHQTGWLGALDDPQLGPVLATMHQSPQRDWGMTQWADFACMSRASFARRFRELVGQPPMTYLTQLRMGSAGRRLRHTSEDLEQIALSVGYGSAFSFSKAFKRHYGQAPGQYRRAHLQAL